MSVKKSTKTYVWERDNYQCKYCHRYMKHWAIMGDYRITVDHVIPKSHGGTGTKDNLVACCYNCNQAKGKREQIIIYKK